MIVFVVVAAPERTPARTDVHSDNACRALMLVSCVVASFVRPAPAEMPLSIRMASNAVDPNVTPKMLFDAFVAVTVPVNVVAPLTVKTFVQVKALTVIVPVVVSAASVVVPVTPRVDPKLTAPERVVAPLTVKTFIVTVPVVVNAAKVVVPVTPSVDWNATAPDAVSVVQDKAANDVEVVTAKVD